MTTVHRVHSGNTLGHARTNHELKFLHQEGKMENKNGDFVKLFAGDMSLEYKYTDSEGKAKEFKTKQYIFLNGGSDERQWMVVGGTKKDEEGKKHPSNVTVTINKANRKKMIKHLRTLAEILEEDGSSDSEE
jgi:hypothetical protein